MGEVVQQFGEQGVVYDVLRLRVDGEALDCLFGGKEVALAVGDEQFVGGFGQAQFGRLQALCDLFGELGRVERRACDGEVALAEECFVPGGGVRFVEVGREEDEAAVFQSQFGEAAQGVAGCFVGFFGVQVKFEQALRRKESP